MGSRSKRSGSKWERDLAKELGKQAEASKRIAGSGALGTNLNEPRLLGDVYVEYPFLNKPLRIEAKYGYGGSKQMTVKREWMTKCLEEGKRSNSHSAVALKFRDVTTGEESAKWICFTVEEWNRIVEELNYLFDDLREYWEYKYEENESI